MSELKPRVSAWDIFVATMKIRFLQPLIHRYTIRQVEMVPREEIFRREEEELQKTITNAEKALDNHLDAIADTQDIATERTPILVEMRENLENLANQAKQMQDPVRKQALIAQVTIFAQSLVAEEQNFEQLQQDLRDMEVQAKDMEVQIEATEAQLNLKKIQNKLVLSKVAVTDLLNGKNDMLEKTQGAKTTTASAIADLARTQAEKRHADALARDQSVKRSSERQAQRAVIRSGNARVTELLNEVLGENLLQQTTVSSQSQNNETTSTTSKGVSA